VEDKDKQRMQLTVGCNIVPSSTYCNHTTAVDHLAEHSTAVAVLGRVFVAEKRHSSMTENERNRNIRARCYLRASLEMNFPSVVGYNFRFRTDSGNSHCSTWLYLKRVSEK
jgi:hypothetical protein